MVTQTRLTLGSPVAAVRNFAVQENVLAESSMMVPETRQRLEAALADLQSYVVSGHHRAAPYHMQEGEQQAVTGTERQRSMRRARCISGRVAVRGFEPGCSGS